MKIFWVLFAIAGAGCAPSHKQPAIADSNAGDIAEGDFASLCVTEEMLIEANSSDAEIKQFREDNEGPCG